MGQGSHNPLVTIRCPQLLGTCFTAQRNHASSRLNPGLVRRPGIVSKHPAGHHRWIIPYVHVFLHLCLFIWCSTVSKFSQIFTCLFWPLTLCGSNFYLKFLWFFFSFLFFGFLLFVNLGFMANVPCTFHSMTSYEDALYPTITPPSKTYFTISKS